MTFKLHYDRFCGCTLNFSFWGGGVQFWYFFLIEGCNCSIAPPGYGPGSRSLSRNIRSRSISHGNGFKNRGSGNPTSR